MPRRRKVFLQNTLLVLFGTLIGLGAVELFIRNTLDIYTCDADLGWTYTPGMTGLKISRAGEFTNVVRFNEMGWRGEEHALEKDAAAYRVLLLGDSFIGGLQVPLEEAFPTLVTQHLNDARGRRVEVINAGIDGHGTAQQLVLFNEKAAAYRPDLTVLGIFLYTDLSDNSYRAGHQNHHLAYKCGRPYFTLENGGLQRMEEMRPGGDVQPPLRDRLLGWSTLYSVFFPSSHLTPAFQQRQLFAKEYPEALTESWELTKVLIQTLAEEVAQNGSRFAVLIVPHSIQVGQPLFRLAPEQFTEEQRDRSLHMLRQFMDAQGIAYIDPSSAMRHEIEAGKTLYFEKDGHWTPDGHRVVADVVTRWMHAHCDTLNLAPPTCPP